MGWSEYATGSYSWPYILHLQSRNGELLYYGARHSYSPDDPQFAHIEELWGELRPTLALNEGGHPPVEPSRDDAIRRHGEAGLLRFLAARDNVPVTTLDPSLAQEVAWLHRSYSAEQVKMFFVLRTVAQFTVREGIDSLPLEIDRVLRIYDDTPGLRQAPTSWADVGHLYERHFRGRGRVSQVPLSWFDPVRSDTFLNEMSRTSSDYRDNFIVRLLTMHTSEGHRVFAVVGGSHVVMQERRLRWALRQE
jgi:hypothetical protein